jgi:two-component system, sensor histidine kinase PdtaS
MNDTTTTEIYNEKEVFVLLKEMQHRMKNNLQLILSLINLQLSKNLEEYNADFLKSLKQRIFFLSLINNYLDHTFVEGSIDIGELADQLADAVCEAYKKKEKIIILKHIKRVRCSTEIAVPVGIIINELLTNAFKHAFPEDIRLEAKKYCKIEIVLRQVDDRTELIISDNGFPVVKEKVMKSNSSGMKLVGSLIDQIGGTYEIETNEGTTHKITF